VKDVKEYWQNKEEILGERIVDKFFCEYLGGYPNIRGPSWGILFFSESKLCFQNFTSGGGLASMLRFSNQSQEKEAEYFCYKLKELDCEVEQLNFSIWDKLFLNAEKIIVVSPKSGENKFFSCRFKLSPDHTKLIMNIFQKKFK